jgi:hypothetical protein
VFSSCETYSILTALIADIQDFNLVLRQSRHLLHTCGLIRSSLFHFMSSPRIYKSLLADDEVSRDDDAGKRLPPYMAGTVKLG